MKHRFHRPVRLFAVLAAMLAIVRVEGHTLPPQNEAYFKIESGVLRVLVRLPMATLADARLPLTARSTLDLAVIGPTLDAAVADFAKSADIMDGDQPLKPSALAWVLSTKDDVSFASYQAAIAHLVGSPLPENAEIGANEGFLDAELDYLVPSPSPRVSVRFNGQRVGGEFLPTQATYFAASGEARSMRIVGAPRRVSFEPSGLDAATMFLRLGARRLWEERELLLFVFCLAIPLRKASLLGMTLAAYVTSGVLIALVPFSPGVGFTLAFQLTASMTLVMAALQNMAMPREPWVRAVCVVFGLASGVGAGLAARQLLPFAGSHGFVSLVLLLGTVTAAAFLLAPLFRALVGLLQRLPVPGRALIILLSLVPLHMGLHRVQANGWLLIDAGNGMGRAWIAHWPALLAVLTLVLLALAVRVSGRGPRFAPAGDGHGEPHQPGEPGR